MAKLITTIATVAVIAAITATLALVFSPEAHQARQINNHYTEQYQRLQLEEQQNWQRQYEPIVQAVSAGAIVTLTGIAVLGAAALVYALALALVHAAQSLRPEHRYRVRELEARKLVLMADAQHRHPLPIQTLTYSPHFSNRIDQQGALPGDTAHDAQPASVPTFAQLLQAGTIGPDTSGRAQPLILGYTSEGKELYGSWLDLYSTAVGGLPGTGKTTSQRYLAAQTALHGAKFVVADPHYGAADDSLGGTLAPLLAHCGLCDVASNDKAILDAVKMVQGIGEKRIAGDKDRAPIILWVDESTSLLNRSTVGPALAELLEGIAQEYRKVAVYASISGQIWTGERSGGTALRDSLASCLVHRMKRSQARMLVSTEAARLVETLQPGRAVLYRTSGAADTIAIPNTTSQDVKTVAGLLSDQAPTMPRVEVVGSRSGQGLESSDTAPVRGEVWTAQDAHILHLLRSGKTPQEITRELSGSKAGRAYNDMLSVVNGVIHRAVSGEQVKAVGDEL
jgi:hypothetical protein